VYPDDWEELLPAYLYVDADLVYHLIHSVDRPVARQVGVIIEIIDEHTGNRGFTRGPIPEDGGLVRFYVTPRERFAMPEDGRVARLNFIILEMEAGWEFNFNNIGNRQIQSWPGLLFMQGGTDGVTGNVAEIDIDSFYLARAHFDAREAVNERVENLEVGQFITQTDVRNIVTGALARMGSSYPANRTPFAGNVTIASIEEVERGLRIPTIRYGYLDVDVELAFGGETVVYEARLTFDGHPSLQTLSEAETAIREWLASRENTPTSWGFQWRLNDQWVNAAGATVTGYTNIDALGWQLQQEIESRVVGRGLEVMFGGVVLEPMVFFDSFERVILDAEE
jgi:hypothetical protein